MNKGNTCKERSGIKVTHMYVEHRNDEKKL